MIFAQLQMSLVTVGISGAVRGYRGYATLNHFIFEMRFAQRFGSIPLFYVYGFLFTFYSLIISFWLHAVDEAG